MRRLVLIAASLLLAAVVSGCAHPISLAPDVASLVGTGTNKIDRKVGLFVAEEDRKREVTTPGGGGDKVSYFPYRDIETAIYVVLSESFTSVSKVNGATDPKVKEDGLSYIFTPSIVTTSSSPSLLTWPPTLFTIELTCKVHDAQGRPAREVAVRGEGRAEFSEFRSNHSMAAKRAVEDMLKKLISALSAPAWKDL